MIMEKSIKKIVVTLTAIFFCCVTLKAETVHIEVAGTLKDLLGDKQTTIIRICEWNGCWLYSCYVCIEGIGYETVYDSSWR